PDTIAALRTRNIAFLEKRLVDDRARGDFFRSLGAGYDYVLSRPIRELLDPKTLIGAIVDILSDQTIRGFVAPIAREVHRRVLASLRSEETKLGDYVPADARKAIDDLLARPDLLPEELVRKVCEAEITETLMRDVIYDALVEFNETANPFFAEWGLPALIKRFVPIGSGAVLSSMSAVRAEFDKRLEPEIRKFLLSFSRRAKTKLADFLVASAGDPKFIGLRQSIVAFFYEESLSKITKSLDDDTRMTVDDAAEAIVLEVLHNSRPRERLLAELEQFLSEHGDETLGAWLGRIGVTERPNLDGLAELLWPYLRLALESPPARAFYERVTWDFYATLTASPTTEDAP
ncbi:MAG TPA: hypothetical protein VM580_28840, partial [Labilithrix sp.]|nr:hypothetical protein [Labilithrix sp.]